MGGPTAATALLVLICAQSEKEKALLYENLYEVSAFQCPYLTIYHNTAIYLGLTE